ncbi:MAG: hypothetical protein PHZ26_06040, partial [Candidatus Gracilibacteria bacterium]|nr:hypothetical protein [Candidatus Gracilibacteria bacterium]
MQVLTYVNGVLTVINGDDFFRDTHPKPSFIISEEFYYEPSLRLTQGRDLTLQEISEAENFINNFSFPKLIHFDPKYVHCVDKFGNYLGFKIKNENEFEVSSAPDEFRQGLTWDFENGNWYESALIDKDSGIILGTGLNIYFNNSMYIKASLVNQNICLESQYYDFCSKSVKVNINIMKKNKRIFLQNRVNELLLNAVNGEIYAEHSA